MITLFFFLFQSSIFLHEFHVSITQVNYIDKELQCTMRVFTDDLEMQMEKDYGYKVSVDDEDRAKTDSVLRLLLVDYFKLEQAGKALHLQYLGMEREIDMTYLHFFYSCPVEPKNISLSNRLFFDSFDDQSNIVNLRWGEETRSAFLTAATPEKTIEF